MDAANAPTDQPTNMHLRLSADIPPEVQLQTQSRRQDRADCRVAALCSAARGICYLSAVLAIAAGFYRGAQKSSEHYTVFYFLWMAMAVVTALLVRMWKAFVAASDHWYDARRVHIVISAMRDHSEFKAVCRG